MYAAVIREALMAWNTMAIMVRRPLRYDPSLVHRASRPVNRANTPKKRAMSMKANMNRVMKK